MGLGCISFLRLQKLPVSWWFKTTERYFLTVLEAGSLNQGVSRARLSPKASGEGPSFSLLANQNLYTVKAAKPSPIEVGALQVQRTSSSLKI